jgi:hypothetical protein
MVLDNGQCPRHSRMKRGRDWAKHFLRDIKQALRVARCNQNQVTLSTVSVSNYFRIKLLHRASPPLLHFGCAVPYALPNPCRCNPLYGLNHSWVPHNPVHLCSYSQRKICNIIGCIYLPCSMICGNLSSLDSRTQYALSSASIKVRVSGSDRPKLSFTLIKRFEGNFFK